MSMKTDFEIELAAEQVEKSQAELQKAIGSLEDSLKETTQKVSQAVHALKKYPGLIWAVAGAIGATAVIDYFTDSPIDSESTRSYNPE